MTQLRLATTADAAVLTEIEVEAFPDPSWAAEDFLRYDCLIAEVNVGDEGFVVAGFLVSRETSPGGPSSPAEREILNLAVRKRFRRLGLASKLLRHEVKLGATVFLEVRASNNAAIQVYEKAGFTQIGKRAQYYSDPLESAIVMCAK